MLYVDIPTLPEFKQLNDERADACVSIYLETTPLSQQIDGSRITLRNLARDAETQLGKVGFDKRRTASLMEQLDDLVDDDEFWRLQANSLAILATPDSIRTFRLANRLSMSVDVSDRFHLKPLLRAITFPHSAFVLALSENAVRLVEISADLVPATVRIDGMPKDAASSVGKSTLNDRSPSGRIQGLEGQKVRFRQYLRQVDTALRPVLSGREIPLILAATEPMQSLFRSLNTYPGLLSEVIADSPDRMSDAELATAARPILDRAYERDIAAFKELYKTRGQQGRATSDLSQAARAATAGAVDSLLVDIDAVNPGLIDDQGAITFAEKATAASYGVVDEIAGRALASGARVLGVRKNDLPGEGDVAAILRYAI